MEARASLAEKLNLPAQKLQDYEALLKLQPNRYELRIEAIALAAHMGLLDTTVFHAGYLQFFQAVKEDFEFKILLADAYRESGYLAGAVERYRDFLEQTSGENEATTRHLRIRS